MNETKGKPTTGQTATGCGHFYAIPMLLGYPDRDADEDPDLGSGDCEHAAPQKTDRQKLVHCLLDSSAAREACGPMSSFFWGCCPRVADRPRRDARHQSRSIGYPAKAFSGFLDNPIRLRPSQWAVNQTGRSFSALPCDDSANQLRAELH